MSSVNPYEAPQASLDAADTNVTFDETSPFKANGRFGRAAYVVYSIGFTILLMVIFSAVSAVTALLGEAVMFIGMAVMYVAMLYFSFVFLIRRLHDLNWSGWLSILTIIPLVNLAIYIPALFFRGTEGANDYGPPRRYVKSHGVIAVLLATFFFLGIFAAISIPAYQDYQKRAQMERSIQQQ